MRSVIFALAILLALYGCTQSGSQSNGSGNQSVPPNGSADGNQTDLTQAMCQDAGGHWNTQGICCRGLPPGEACNKLCVAVCDCGGIAGFRCPAGYACADYYPNSTTPDAMGICVKIGQNSS